MLGLHWDYRNKIRDSIRITENVLRTTVGFYKNIWSLKWTLKIIRGIPKIIKTLSKYLASLDKIIWNVHIWLFLAQKRGRCSKQNLRVSLSKICRCVLGGFRRFFDQNLYISTFFDKKTGPWSPGKKKGFTSQKLPI